MRAGSTIVKEIQNKKLFRLEIVEVYKICTVVSYKDNIKTSKKLLSNFRKLLKKTLVQERAWKIFRCLSQMDSASFILRRWIITICFLLKGDSICLLKLQLTMPGVLASFFLVIRQAASNCRTFDECARHYSWIVFCWKLFVNSVCRQFCPFLQKEKLLLAQPLLFPRVTPWGFFCINWPLLLPRVIIPCRPFNYYKSNGS